MEKLPSGFPLGVLCVNVLGGFLMGLLQGWMRRTGNTFATGYCLLGTGFLGGFTTFSTFSLDTFLLYRSGDASLAALNIALNMVLCLCAVWGGYALLAPARNAPPRPLEKDFYTLPAFSDRNSPCIPEFLPERKRYAYSADAAPAPSALYGASRVPASGRRLSRPRLPLPAAASARRQPMDWRMYRSDMEAYRQCVEAYLATARQDAERIRKRMEKAVREYNEESGNL